MISPFSHVTTSQSFMKGLACASLNPGLQGILIFDAPYAAILEIESILMQMLEVVTEKKIERVHVRGFEIDEDLWGHSGIFSNENGQSIGWHQGLLTQENGISNLRLIMIPDLAKLHLASARACVTLVGADVAHLERDGQSRLWQPQICWLASCARNQVGTLSPHLLDRFVLRLHWLDQKESSVKNYNWLKQFLDGKSSNGTEEYPLSLDMKERLQKAAKCYPSMGEEAITQVLKYAALDEIRSHRREITLARLAHTIAQFDDAELVSPTHVDEAASLIRLFPALRINQEAVPIQEREDLQDEDFCTPLSSPPAPLDEAATSSQLSLVPSKMNEADRTEVLGEVLLPLDPYPEDKAPIEREAASLKLPPQYHSKVKFNRGVVIGVEQANTLHDLAVVSTILAAAPYQRIRRERSKQLEDEPLLHLSRSDLRRYRRAPIAESMLILLIDYTSLRQLPDWQQTLFPYLRKAYVERASICVVQVGADTVSNELQAERISARSILAPSIEEALEARHGKATPLAHGLDIALSTLQHALQHGRNTVRQASLVVISDGRGNIPLEVSRQGFMPHIASVNRRGIEDALVVAQRVRGMKGLQKPVFLNPQSMYYPELPYALARELGADIIDISFPARVEG
jgi:magnesium chelatase subunit D